MYSFLDGILWAKKGWSIDISINNTWSAWHNVSKASFVCSETINSDFLNGLLHGGATVTKHTKDPLGNIKSQQLTGFGYELHRLFGN